MSLETAISMEPVKAKLRTLQQHMPNEDSLIYDFGAYLADRLNPELVPAGFFLEAELTLHDLQADIDGYTQQPVPRRFQGYPPVLYAVLSMRVPEIAAATCPDDFAQGVATMYDELQEKPRARRAPAK